MFLSLLIIENDFNKTGAESDIYCQTKIITPLVSRACHLERGAKRNSSTQIMLPEQGLVLQHISPPVPSCRIIGANIVSCQLHGQHLFSKFKGEKGKGGREAYDPNESKVFLLFDRLHDFES